MKTYGQYCAVARGLDVVGDRWTLLIVRELLGGPRRYGELRAELPGIATNLLGDRLKALVADGVVAHGPDGRYALTPWGEGLRDVVHAIGRWAMPLMARPPGDDAFHAPWFGLLLAIHLGDVDPSRPDAVVELRIGDEPPVALVARAGRLTVEPEVPDVPDVPPDLVLTGPPDGVGGLVAGFMSLAEAAGRGVTTDGDTALLDRLRPDLSAAVRS